VRAYFSALNGGDRDGILALFADDGSIIADGLPSAAGREQLEAFFDGIFAGMRFARDVHIERIVESDGLAAARSHTTGTVTMLAHNTTQPGISRELFVLRRSDGAWRIVDYMFNLPPAPGRRVGLTQRSGVANRTDVR
jgi:uncharacterized protein (TIGR02246 family)